MIKVFECVAKNQKGTLMKKYKYCICSVFLIAVIFGQKSDERPVLPRDSVSSMVFKVKESPTNVSNIPAILQELKIAKSYRHKRTLIRSLGSLQEVNTQVLTTLKKIMLNDKDRKLKCEAIKAFGSIGKKARPVRQDLYRMLSKPRLRYDAALSLVQVEAYSEILQAAKSRDKSLREMAAECIFHMEDRAEQLQSTIDELLQDSSKKVRQAAQRAQSLIGKYHNWKKKNQELLQNAQSWDSKLQILAAKKMSTMDDEAIPFLIKMIDDNNEDVRKQALVSINIHKNRMNNIYMSYKTYMIAKLDREAKANKKAKQTIVKGFWYVDLQQAMKEAAAKKKPLLLVLRCNP
ncbi:HEAT repeat domain-containing protein [Candidatus Uabimicrobium sp. HlEnr_7]|uniref:HEAT repeat domain-containing protein n=1 Tax=Candidatus Uabimicrobium helgolandensis TaxID=3095367 RepID=UPI0035572CFA